VPWNIDLIGAYWIQRLPCNQVLRSNATTYRRLVAQASQEPAQGQSRNYAEQGFLLDAFPAWKELPWEFNIDQYTARHVKREGDDAGALRTGYLLHEKLAFMSRPLAARLNVSAEWKALQALPRECVWIFPGVMRLCGLNRTEAAAATGAAEMLKRFARNAGVGVR